MRFSLLHVRKSWAFHGYACISKRSLAPLQTEPGSVRIAVVDVETTGLNLHKSQLIEVDMLVVDGLGIIPTLFSFCAIFLGGYT